jgi:hypothetical protein
MAKMILGDQGAGKSPMMNSIKTVLKLIETDMQNVLRDVTFLGF